MSCSSPSGNIAVIDVETTGLFPFRHDRVVEVAAVVIQAGRGIEHEFVSLVNPVRDIGPSRIHGLTTEQVLHAPQFGDIAALLIDALNGSVAIAGHNVRFDRQFLENEFSRLGQPFPDCFSLCTMELGGGRNLAECCLSHGVPIEGQAHHALADARATARLLLRLFEYQSHIMPAPDRLAPIQWPTFLRTGKQPLTRDESLRRQAEAPTFLQRLRQRLHGQPLPGAEHGAVMAYVALLDRVLEDRRVDDCETDALLEMAYTLGLSKDQVLLAHQDYFEQIAKEALVDGIVTDAERRDLRSVTRLLGQEKSRMNAILNQPRAKLREMGAGASSVQGAEPGLAGKRICFTGEMQCRLDGQVISREVAEELATRSGLIVMNAVTKKLVLCPSNGFTTSDFLQNHVRLPMPDEWFGTLVV